MKIAKVYIRKESIFGQRINQWAADHKLECTEVAGTEEEVESIDGLVIFNQNQDVAKEILDIRTIFDHHQKPVQRIDINGTLAAGVSNFALWLERNRCRNILLLGAESLIENPNLERYLDNLN